MNILTKEILIKYKKLRRNNPEIEGVQEFFRDYVKNVGEDFSVEHVGIIEAYYDDLKKYHKILKDYGLNLSIEETKLIILGQNIDEFIEFINKNNLKIKDLFNLNKEVIEYLFSEDGVIKDKNDLKKFINHSGFKDFILFYMNAYDISIVKLLFGKNGVIKSVNEMGYIYKSGLYGYITSGILTITVLKGYIYGFSYNNIGGNLNSLFSVQSNGSVLLMEIKKLMEEYPEKEIYEILREKSNYYIENNKIENQEKGEKEIAIYLRYGRTVNYPEIGEAIIIFLQETIKKGIVKGVKGIKILPKTLYIIPRNNILDKNTRFCNVSGKEFKYELNNNSIPFYLSHSTNEAKGLAILSGSMETKKGQINLGLELEKGYDKDDTNNKSINEIFDILMGIIRKINEKKD